MSSAERDYPASASAAPDTGVPSIRADLGRFTSTDSPGCYPPSANGTPELFDYVCTGMQYMIGPTYCH